MRTAITAGVRCIEHGQLLDEETVALMAEKGIWWCLQPFLDDEDAHLLAGPNRAKLLQMAAGTDNAYSLAIKHQVQVAFGTDTLFEDVDHVSEDHGLPIAYLCYCADQGFVLNGAKMAVVADEIPVTLLHHDPEAHLMWRMAKG